MQSYSRTSWFQTHYSLAFIGNRLEAGKKYVFWGEWIVNFRFIIKTGPFG